MVESHTDYQADDADRTDSKLEILIDPETGRVIAFTRESGQSFSYDRLVPYHELDLVTESSDLERVEVAPEMSFDLGVPQDLSEEDLGFIAENIPRGTIENAVTNTLSNPMSDQLVYEEIEQAQIARQIGTVVSVSLVLSVVSIFGIWFGVTQRSISVTVLGGFLLFLIFWKIWSWKESIQ
jgi:hypothetical protein